MTFYSILVTLIFVFYEKGAYNMTQATIQAVWTTDTQSETYQDAIAIRYDVFITEQKFPEGSDIDDLEAAAEHLVLYDHTGRPLATARIYAVDEHVFRIERVAVLKAARKMGLGKVLIHKMEERIAAHGGQKIILNSESPAVGFYKKYGYEKVGAEFLDFHIMHQKMAKALP